jgi:hypothetical protein
VRPLNNENELQHLDQIPVRSLFYIHYGRMHTE